MKKSNVFGAVLCSAALACSMALPAFAADTATQDSAIVDGSKTFTTTDKTQSTLVKGLAYGSNYVEDYISATVPATLTVVLADPIANPNGGAFKYVPQASAYKISNASSKAINVTKIVGTSANADWKLMKASELPANPTQAASMTTNYGVNVTINGYDIADTSASFTPIAIEKDSSAGLSIAGQAWWKTSTLGGTTDTGLGTSPVSMVDVAYTVALAK